MAYIPAAQTRDGVAKVVYSAKDGKTSRTFAALDWLAQLVRLWLLLDLDVSGSHADSLSKNTAILCCFAHTPCKIKY